MTHIEEIYSYNTFNFFYITLVSFLKKKLKIIIMSKHSSILLIKFFCVCVCGSLLEIPISTIPLPTQFVEIRNLAHT